MFLYDAVYDGVACTSQVVLGVAGFGMNDLLLESGGDGKRVGN